MPGDQFSPSELNPDDVWKDWLNLHNNQFNSIHEKIRERRKMYKLDWSPAEDSITSKRWRDYVIDPLPRNDIDFKADRLCGRPLLIKIPTEQLDIDVVDVLNNQNGFQGISPNSNLMNLTKKLRETAKELAQKRADSIEKFLNGTLYINQVLRKENLEQRWAMHFLVDGYSGYFCYYDDTATDDEYPIVIRALDPLSVVYSRGDQKKDKFMVGRQDRVFNLRREFGSSIFQNLSDNSICYVIDAWYRTKSKTTNPLDGTEKWVPEVWHCTYLGSSGSSGDPYYRINAPIQNTKGQIDALGWVLKPQKTDYFEIPGDMVEARVTPLTEDPDEMVSGDLDAAREIWNARNYFLTRTHRLAKLGSGADIITKGLAAETIQHLGKGEGATVNLPSDSNINPDTAVAWLRPTPVDPNMQQHAVELNAMIQQALLPVTSLGGRGGTVSGAQIDTLDQGAAVRLQTFVNAMNMLNTGWSRTCMQIASVFFKDPSKKIPIYGLDRNSNPFAGTISSADINGDYTVFVDVNPNTVMEELQQALTAIRLTSDNPSEAILSHQTVREQYLNTPYNWQEEQRIKREAEEFNEDTIKIGAQKNIAQLQMQVLANLEQIRVQSILKGAPPNPMIMQIMQSIQDQLLNGIVSDQSGDESGGAGRPSTPSIMMPTNENAAPGMQNMSNPMDARTYPPMSTGQMQGQMQSQARQNGMPISNESF